MRHLICHIYPLMATRTWRRTVQHLRARSHIFDGLRIVSIAIGPDTEEPEAVVEAFGDFETEFRFVENDPALCEGASFSRLLRAVSDEPGETFYCHSKGASHRQEHVSQRWADVGFHLCLDYPNEVSESLIRHATAGPFRRVENRMGVPWHYSGTLFWFNNLYGMNAPKTQDRNCVERWPAENYEAKDSADIGLSDCRNLYDEINWRSWITRRFQKEVLWNAERKAEREASGTRWGDLPPTVFQPLQVIYEEAMNANMR